MLFRYNSNLRVVYSLISGVEDVVSDSGEIAGMEVSSDGSPPANIHQTCHKLTTTFALCVDACRRGVCRLYGISACMHFMC